MRLPSNRASSILRSSLNKYTRSQAYFSTSSNKFAQDYASNSQKSNDRIPFVPGIRNHKRRKAFELDPRKYEKNDDSSIRLSSKQFLDSLKNRTGGALFHESALYGGASTNKSPRTLGEVKPGDFVDIQASSGSAGIVLPTENSVSLGLGNRQVAILVVNGDLKKFGLSDIVTTFPAFIDDELTQRAIIKEEEGYVFEIGSITEEDVKPKEVNIDTLKARSGVCKKLRMLLHQTELQRSRFLPLFEKRYLSEKMQQNISFTQISVSDVCKQLLLDLGLNEEQAVLESNAPEKIYAVHQLMLSVPEVFRLDPTSHRLTNTFTIVPHADRSAQNAVQQHIESSLIIKGKGGAFTEANQVEDFIRKVKKIRELRSASQGKLVVSEKPLVLNDELSSQIEWNQADRDILLFLRSALGIRRDFFSESSSGMVFHILKQCGYEINMKPDPLEGQGGPYVQTVAMTKMQIAKILHDLGLLTPWDNLSNLDNEFQQLTTTERQTKQLEMQDWTDIDEGIRKDVRSTVYVIDDANAQELDDGISLERTKDSNQSWIHIHIADPTSVIQPQDEIATFAANRGLTYYMNENTWPMLPKEYVQRLGLLSDKDDADTSRRAMTFSVKIDHSTGAALECNIGLSKLHDVRIISYSEANDVLQSLSNDEQWDDLRTLFKLSKTIQRRRFDVNGGHIIKGTRRGLDIRITSLPLPISPIRSSSLENLTRQMFTGFPTMELNEYQEKDNTEEIFDSRSMISEFATSACRVAGYWMEKYDVPALYRCQLSLDDPKITKQFLALKDENGIILSKDALQEKFRQKSVMLSPTPGEHFSIGIRTNASKEAAKLSENKNDILLNAGYVRTTSPLRRYADMMMHWQIRHKIRMLHQSDSNQKQDQFPFSHEVIRNSIPSITRKENWSKNLQLSSKIFWTALRLHRAYLARLTPEKRKEIEPFDQYACFPSRKEDLEDETINAILDQDQDAMITIGDLRTLPNNETVIVVNLQSCGLLAQCYWPRSRIPKIGETIKVRITDMLFQGSAPTITVERVDVR